MKHCGAAAGGSGRLLLLRAPTPGLLLDVQGQLTQPCPGCSAGPSCLYPASLHTDEAQGS